MSQSCFAYCWFCQLILNIHSFFVVFLPSLIVCFLINAKPLVCGRFSLFLPSYNSSFFFVLFLFLDRASLWVRGQWPRCFSHFQRLNTRRRLFQLLICCLRLNLRLIRHLFVCVCVCFFVYGSGYPCSIFVFRFVLFFYLVNLDTLLRFNTFVVFHFLLLVWTNVRGISICLTLFSLIYFLLSL